MIFILLRMAVSIVLGVGATRGHAVTAQGYSSRGYVEPISLFDQLSPGTGWAASMTHLYWTANNGRRWREITPSRVSPDAPIETVYFTDRQHGWVPLLKTPTDRRPRMQVAMTSDGGATWRYVAVDLTHLSYVASTPPTIASMSFSDSRHGWIMIRTASSQLSRTGCLLRTIDGGTHWTMMAQPPIDGAISFGSASNGVLTDALNPYGNTAVWHTQNGGRTWAASALPMPPMCPKCVVDRISQAYFYDAQDAMLTAIIRKPGIDDFVSVEYGSMDGGATWSVNGRMPPQAANAGGPLLMVADGHTVGVNAAPHHQLLLSIDGTGSAATLPAAVPAGGIDRVSVAEDHSVWALFVNPRAELFSIEPRSGKVRCITPGDANLQVRRTSR